MSFFEGFITNVIYILFPLIVFVLYNVYTKNLNKKVSQVFLGFVLFTSLYLIIRFETIFDNNFCIILCNVPLLISYLNKQKYTPIILSFIICFYYISVVGFNIYLILFEYIIYYFIFNIFNKKKYTYVYFINIFTLIKSSVLSFEMFYFINSHVSFMNNFMYILFLMVMFYVVSYCTFYLLNKCIEIVDLNNVLKELEKEKTLRQSLFKMTHEIKNPIAVCKGYLDMIDITNQDKTNKYLDIIKNEIDRTLIIMDDFLDYTKIKINKDVVDVNLLIEDTFFSLDSLLKNNRVKVELNLIDEEVFMNIDYNRVKQVIVNIVKNSIEAKKEEMLIKVKTYLFSNKFYIVISDNGIGMDDETLNKIYEMFYTTKDKGTGLGVSLSKEIIELHDGFIKYDSTFGVGTSVTIELPINI